MRPGDRVRVTGGEYKDKEGVILGLFRQPEDIIVDETGEAVWKGSKVQEEYDLWWVSFEGGKIDVAAESFLEVIEP